LFGYRALESAKSRAVDLGEFRKPHRCAAGGIEHPFRNFNEHRMEGRLRQFAEVRHVGMGPASLARQNTTTIPGVPRITEPPGLEYDTVGFL
jgi:hypothetical protein